MDNLTLMIYEKDDNGDTVLHGNAKVEFYDFRLEEARDLYVKGIKLYPVYVNIKSCSFSCS